MTADTIIFWGQTIFDFAIIWVIWTVRQSQDLLMDGHLILHNRTSTIERKLGIDGTQPDPLDE